MKILIDILIGVAITLVVGVVIYVAAIKPGLDVSYVCYDYNTELGKSRYVEVINCEYKDDQYHCEEGVYNDCHEGSF